MSERYVVTSCVNWNRSSENTEESARRMTAGGTIEDCIDLVADGDGWIVVLVVE